MNIKTMAAASLLELVDDRVRPLARKFEDTMPEIKENLKQGPWMTLYSIANRLCEKRDKGERLSGGTYDHTVDSLAGDYIHREINKTLYSFCMNELTSILPGIGGDATAAFEQFTEGLITESELLMKVIDILTWDGEQDSPQPAA